MGLAAAIAAAEGDSDATNTINLVPGAYAATELLIQVPPTQTLSIVGQGPGVVLQSDGSNRVLEVTGSVVLENLSIEGGKVQAATPGAAAEGGGLLVDGGNVTLINVEVSGNSARGAGGAASAGRSHAYGWGSALAGGSGGDAYGGGIYLATGTLSLVGCNVSSNKAVGGGGGEGAPGKAGANGQTGTGTSRRADGQFGQGGGAGGTGGHAFGGGICVAQTTARLIICQGAIGGNAAQGGAGGVGGDGGGGGDGIWGDGGGGAPDAVGTGGGGGDSLGGEGGAASGGGLAVCSGVLTAWAQAIDSNLAQGGNGGIAGGCGCGGSGYRGGPGGSVEGGGGATRLVAASISATAPFPPSPTPTFRTTRPLGAAAWTPGTAAPAATHSDPTAAETITAVWVATVTAAPVAARRAADATCGIRT